MFVLKNTMINVCTTNLYYDKCLLVPKASLPVFPVWPILFEGRKVYAVRRHGGSLCTQKQPETAALRALKAATRKHDPKGGQPALFDYCLLFDRVAMMPMHQHTHRGLASCRKAEHSTPEAAHASFHTAGWNQCIDLLADDDDDDGDGDGDGDDLLQAAAARAEIMKHHRLFAKGYNTCASFSCSPPFFPPSPPPFVFLSVGRHVTCARVLAANSGL